MLKEFWYIEFKDGNLMYFETELDMYKYLYEKTFPGTVECYGKDK